MLDADCPPRTDRTQPAPAVRIDKWLWAARFFAARNLARQAVEAGRVLLGGARVKPAHVVRVGDELWVRTGEVERTVRVLGVSERRGPAPVAQTLYEETPESAARRLERHEARRLHVEPAQFIEGGRPTKRDRRRLSRIARSGSQG